MVGKIYELKNEILQRIDVKEMGELVDMVKDLAEAEASCWQAEYHRTVIEAMKGSNERQGYQMASRGSMGYDSLKPYLGYHEDIIAPVRQALQSASTEDRAKLKDELRKMMGV